MDAPKIKCGGFRRMDKKRKHMTNKKRLAYFISVLGVSSTLLWIGIFKFTPTEAAEIRPLVENHPAIGWLYRILSEQMVSNLIGMTEILVGLGLLLSLFYKKVGLYAGLASGIIFTTTLSFLFTTPEIWTTIDGIPTTDFFIYKDICFLGISLWIWAEADSA